MKQWLRMATPQYASLALWESTPVIHRDGQISSPRPSRTTPGAMRAGARQARRTEQRMRYPDVTNAVLDTLDGFVGPRYEQKLLS